MTIGQKMPVFIAAIQAFSCVCTDTVFPQAAGRHINTIYLKLRLFLPFKHIPAIKCKYGKLSAYLHNIIQLKKAAFRLPCCCNQFGGTENQSQVKSTLPQFPSSITSNPF